MVVFYHFGGIFGGTIVNLYLINDINQMFISLIRLRPPVPN